MWIPTSGNSIIDEDHRTLTESLKAIETHLRDGIDRPALIRHLRDFLEQVSGHFTVEEAIMRGAGYARAREHANTHHTLLSTMNTLIGTLENDPPAPTMAVCDRVIDLLFEHELVEDSDYWACLRNITTSVIDPWPEDLTVGIERIDSHHRALAGFLDRLNVPDVKNDRTALVRSLAELLTLSDHHFQTEKQLWSEIDGLDPEFAVQHDAAHASLQESLGRMTPRLRDGSLDLNDFLEDFLVFWLVDHIRTYDVPHFRQIIAKVGPQVAATLE